MYTVQTIYSDEVFDVQRLLLNTVGEGWISLVADMKKWTVTIDPLTYFICIVDKRP